MRYGTRAMLELAVRYNSGFASAKEIAESQGLPPKYLEHLLATLRNAGLVRSVRGAQGGHTLTKSPHHITLHEIFDALEGSEGFVDCTTDPHSCSKAEMCVTQEVWAQMYSACVDVLKSTTLGDLVRRTEERQGSLTNMYYI
jgi:Rrf2 family protein